MGLVFVLFGICLWHLFIKTVLLNHIIGLSVP
jgi:multisubunit Na+/H+ antiporter MnhC subunit